MNDKRTRGAGQPWKNENYYFMISVKLHFFVVLKRSRPYPIRFLKIKNNEGIEII